MDNSIQLTQFHTYRPTKMRISSMPVYASRIDDMCIINTIVLFEIFTKLNLSYKNSSFLLQSIVPGLTFMNFA